MCGLVLFSAKEGVLLSAIPVGCEGAFFGVGELLCSASSEMPDIEVVLIGVDESGIESGIRDATTTRNLQGFSLALQSLGLNLTNLQCQSVLDAFLQVKVKKNN